MVCNHWWVITKSGMWGSKCRSSTVDKENCALQCLSPQCYDHVYGGDPVNAHKPLSYRFCYKFESYKQKKCEQKLRGNWKLKLFMLITNTRAFDHIDCSMKDQYQ